MHASVLVVFLLAVAASEATIPKLKLGQMLRSKRTAATLANSEFDISLYWKGNSSTGCEGTAYEFELDVCTPWNGVSFKATPLTGSSCSGMVGFKLAYYESSLTCGGAVIEQSVTPNMCQTIGSIAFLLTAMNIPTDAFCGVVSSVSRMSSGTMTSGTYTDPQCSGTCSCQTETLSNSSSGVTLKDNTGGCSTCCLEDESFQTSLTTCINVNGTNQIYRATASYSDAFCGTAVSNSSVIAGQCFPRLLSYYKMSFSQSFTNAICDLVIIMDNYSFSFETFVSRAEMKAVLPFTAAVIDSSAAPVKSAAATLSMSLAVVVLIACAVLL